MEHKSILGSSKLVGMAEFTKIGITVSYTLSDPSELDEPGPDYK